MPPGCLDLEKLDLQGAAEISKYWQKWQQDEPWILVSGGDFNDTMSDSEAMELLIQADVT